jgi:hypothetical protein
VIAAAPDSLVAVPITVAPWREFERDRRPMPRDAPVTIATCLSRVFSMNRISVS